MGNWLQHECTSKRIGPIAYSLQVWK